MLQQVPMRTRCLLLGLLVAATACDKGPEPTFQPDDPKPSEGERQATIEAQPSKATGAAPQGRTQAPLVRRPSSPDPTGGTFPLDEALAGLSGQGPLRAEIRTSMGTLECELYDESAPMTVANFVGLARGVRPWWDAREAEWVKAPYFDGTGFHRVIPDFMIQGGDHLGDGSGDVGYTFDDELDPSLKHDRAGQLCMANKGPNTNAAQFFITDGAAPHLDRMNSYTIFGQCSPTETVARIARVPQSGPPHNRPREPVDIERVRILRE
jgi:peptidyl-prolyl cis-trans isomerase A (cyclophilin A)